MGSVTNLLNCVSVYPKQYGNNIIEKYNSFAP